MQQIIRMYIKSVIPLVFVSKTSTAHTQLSNFQRESCELLSNSVKVSQEISNGGKQGILALLL